MSIGGGRDVCREPTAHYVVQDQNAALEIELQQRQSGEALRQVLGVEFVQFPNRGSRDQRDFDVFRED